MTLPLAQVFFLLALVAKIQSRSTGAPLAACSNLTPNHGVTSQPASTNPYVLSLMDFPQDSNGDFLYTPEASYTGNM